MTTNKVIPITTAAIKPATDICALLAPDPEKPKQDGVVPPDSCSDQLVQPGKRYWITRDGSVGALAATATPLQDAIVFSTPEQLIAGTEHWPMRQLVEVWNKLPDQRRVTRFENRSIAAQRMFRAIESLPLPAPVEEQAPTEESLRPESKTARILHLLRAPGGATLAALMQATGWQAHSVRGFLSGKLSKQMGLRVSSVRCNGERVYALESALQAESERVRQVRPAGEERE